MSGTDERPPRPQRGGQPRVTTFTETDDGRGFHPTSTGYGTGLQGIADRLGALDGSLEVTSRAGAGTSVTGTVPTSPPIPEAEEEVLMS